MDNPYQALLYNALVQIDVGQVYEFTPSKIILTKGNKILHIHWPDVFLATAKGWRFWAKLFSLRVLFVITGFLRIPIVWTAHNIKRTGQHNAALMEKFFWPWFAHKIDGIIYMNKSSKLKAEELFANWSQVPNAVIPHGHYGPIIAANNLMPPSAINKKPNVLFFGSITKYKNANKLLETFLELPLGFATLRIKGKMSNIEPDNELLKILDSLPYDQKENVFFENRFLDDNELIQAIRESDLVVFPYSDVLNSGAAIFALSVGKPILASDTPLFRDLKEQVGDDWVRLISDVLDADMLLRAIKHSIKLRDSTKKPDLSVFDWYLVAQKTKEFYENVLSVRSQRKR
jgi:beta-1,4-mannosyltransferase